MLSSMRTSCRQWRMQTSRCTKRLPLFLFSFLFPSLSGQIITVLRERQSHLKRSDRFSQAVVRQDLLGMYYQLLSYPELRPKPSYWVAFMWKLLVGRDVFGVSESSPLPVPVWMHGSVHCGCARTQPATSQSLLPSQAPDFTQPHHLPLPLLCLSVPCACPALAVAK
jgi:hypothetical protein